MTEFGAEIRSRVAAARRSLATAREAGDDYLAEVLIGELDSLVRIADDHQVILEDDESAA